MIVLEKTGKKNKVASKSRRRTGLFVSSKTQLSSAEKRVSNKRVSSHFANEKFYLLNRELTEKYFNDLYKVRFYQNAALALYDIATGLQQFLAHRAHFAVAKNGSSLIESLSPIWIRNVNPLQVKNESQNWLEFIETLNPETNFVIWASENEITGEILVDSDKAQEIHQLLSHKRIYSIQICHSMDRTEKLFPYAIKILRPTIFSEGQALVVHTERFKVNSQVGFYQNLEHDLKQLETLLEKSKPENTIEIKKYEAQVAQAKNIYFNRFVATTSHLSDRLVLNYSQVNGFALQQALGLMDQDCFAPSKYPFWVLNLWKNWWKEAENENFIRGLVVLSVHALRHNSELVEQLNRFVDEFQRLGSTVNT